MTREQAIAINALSAATRARFMEEAVQCRFARRKTPPSAEQWAACKQEIEEEIEAVLGQDWVQPYLTNEADLFPLPQDAIDWLRERPREIQELIVQFPPGCLVRTKPGAPCHTPVEGSVGIVVAYAADRDGELCVWVRQSPTGVLRAQVAATNLELAHTRAGRSSDDMRRVLGWPEPSKA